MQQKLTNDKQRVRQSLVHYSSWSSHAEVGFHSTVQPGGKVDGQFNPETISSSKVPLKIMPPSRPEYTNTQLDLPGMRSLLLYL
jgi:hypothetical protein